MQFLTDDKLVRTKLIETLEYENKGKDNVLVLEELGVVHGTARVDIAVVNGSMHGYEIKSDLDTLLRLKKQVELYNLVFDKMTLVVGKTHLHESFKMIPEWWGVQTAQIIEDQVIINSIRSEQINPSKDCVSIARLLWKQEALDILEEINSAKGYRSKNRDAIYERLVNVLDENTLSSRVRAALINRQNWRLA